MDSFLRPRRGNKSIAESQDIILKRGEVFFEIDASGISTGSAAKACGKIKMGDGSTTYSNLGYFIDVDTSVVAFTDTSTATSTNQGADYYQLLNDTAPTAQVKSLFGSIKELLYRLATNITTLNNKAPFAFGVDSNNNYGYIKAGADTVTPFRSAPSGNKALGTYTTNGSKSASVSGYATCSFTVNVPGPSGNIYDYINNREEITINVYNYKSLILTLNKLPFRHEIIDTGYYNMALLWENPNKDVIFKNTVVTLNQSYKNFKFMIIEYTNLRYPTYGDGTLQHQIFLTSEVSQFTINTSAAGSIRGSIGDTRRNPSGGGPWIYKNVLARI